MVTNRRSFHCFAGSLIAGCFILGVLLSTKVGAGILPEERKVDWQQAGLSQGIPVYPNGGNAVLDFGAVGDGVADDTAAIQEALNTVPEGEAVYLPNGTYRLTSPLSITRSVVLRGESRLETVLSLDHLKDGIFIGSYSGSSGEMKILSGFSRGARQLQLSGTDRKFYVGAIVEIRQDNDPELYQIGYKGHEPWTNRATGMMNEVVAIEGKEISLKFPLFLNYAKDYSPGIRSVGQTSLAGVENLLVHRALKSTSASGANVVFYGAKQCWLKDIWSERAYSDHVRVSCSLECEIRGNVFNDTWQDSGGKGYGVTLEERSTLVLVEDNSFHHLRHSMPVQLGASGNVYGYNFSIDPFSNDSPEWIFSDISAHGSMANYNLWEGNRAVQGFVDNVHGSNPYNTLFRNHFTKPKPKHFGIGIATNNSSCSVIGNVIGNVIGDAASGEEGDRGELISIDATVRASTILTGNQNGISGEVHWDPHLPKNLEASMYLTQKPSFFGRKAWPIFGPDVGVAETLPAEERWNKLIARPSAIRRSVDRAVDVD